MQTSIKSTEVKVLSVKENPPKNCGEFFSYLRSGFKLVP